jgi:hypothetical protein
METPAKNVINWVNENLPPLSWQIIAMQNMKVLAKHKIFPSRIEDSTKFNAEILASINSFIKDRYQKELPSNFMR